MVQWWVLRGRLTVQEMVFVSGLYATGILPKPAMRMTMDDSSRFSILERLALIVGIRVVIFSPAAGKTLWGSSFFNTAPEILLEMAFAGNVVACLKM